MFYTFTVLQGDQQIKEIQTPNPDTLDQLLGEWYEQESDELEKHMDRWDNVTGYTVRKNAKGE